MRAVIALVGLGLLKICMGASLLPGIKRVIANLDLAAAQQAAAQALEMETAAQVEQHLQRCLKQVLAAETATPT